MQTILSRVRFNSRQMTAMIVFALLASVAQLAAPALVSRMIDEVSGNNEKTIILLAIAMIILSVLMAENFAAFILVPHLYSFLP